jgi:hypothetical protein
VDTMRAFIDGVSWVGQSIVASSLDPQLAISGSALNGSQSISLVMPLNIIPGTYDLDYTGLTYIAIYNPTAATSRLSSSGTLVILENNSGNRRVRGNFQFQAFEPLNPALRNQITSGYFSIVYK